MGCHTWFYKKMEKQPSYQECKDMLTELLNEEIQDCQNYIDGKEDDEDMLRLWEQYDPQKVLKECQESLNRVNNDDKEFVFEEATHVMYLRNVEAGVVIYHKGNFYISARNLPHNIFRTWGYPEDVLESYEDFENFIATHGYRLVRYDTLEETKQAMKKFWEEYPDGIVDFG